MEIEWFLKAGIDDVDDFLSRSVFGVVVPDALPSLRSTGSADSNIPVNDW
jgi:hypothetical protein